MKGTVRKTSSPLRSHSVGLIAAFASMVLLGATTHAGPPSFRSGSRSGTSISVGISGGSCFGPGYGYGYRYGRPWPYYGGSTFYYPPVYTSPPVYVAPPVYQVLPPSSAEYRSVAPSGTYLVAHVQEKLRGYGYYRGPVDGVAGSGTRAAIRNYQVDRGIQVTGRIDQELLADLGL